MNWRFEHPEALLLGLLAAALVVLHLARRRPRPLRVPFLAIWDRSQPDRGGGFKKLRNLLLLVLSVATLLAMTAALAGPHRPGPETEHVLLILDDTASMEALDSDGRTRFEKARDDLANAVASAPPHVVFALGFTAGEGTLALPFGAPKREITARLADSRPAPVSGSAATALAALGPHAEGRSGAEIWIATDAADRFPDVTHGGARVHVRRYGNRSDNIRIAGFAGAWGGWWDPEASLYIRVENSGESRAAFRLSVRGNGEKVVDRPLELEAGDSFETVLPVNRTDQSVTFEGAIEPGGAISIDDRAWCLVPARERKRILLVTDEPGPFVYSAVKVLGDDLDPESSAVADPTSWRSAAGNEDICVFDSTGPGERFPAGGCVIINPAFSLLPGSPTPADETGAAATGWDRSHPVTRGLSFENVYFRKFRPLPPGYHPLVSTDKGAVVGCREGPGGPAVVLSASLLECNLALVSSFPLLFRNAVRWVGRGESAASGPGRCRFQEPGEESGAGAVWIAGEPGGPGIAVVGGDKLVFNFFNGAESNISGSRIEGEPWPVPPRRPSESRPWASIAVAGLILLILDWIVFTVTARRTAGASG